MNQDLIQPDDSPDQPNDDLKALRQEVTRLQGQLSNTQGQLRHLLAARRQDMTELLPPTASGFTDEGRRDTQDQRISQLELMPAQNLTPELLTIANKWFLAKIVNTGPNSEDNYADQRYWVKEQTITNSGEAGTTELTFADEDRDNALWVTATNLPEVGAAAVGAIEHYVQLGRIVFVHRVYDASPIARYVFVSPPDYVECT